MILCFCLFAFPIRLSGFCVLFDFHLVLYCIVCTLSPFCLDVWTPSKQGVDPNEDISQFKVIW